MDEETSQKWRKFWRDSKPILIKYLWVMMFAVMLFAVVYFLAQFVKTAASEE